MPRFSFYLSCGLFSLAACLFVVNPVIAESLEGKVIFVDFEKVVKNSKAYADVEKQLEDHKKKLQIYFTPLQEKLKEQDLALEKSQELVSPEVWALERQKFARNVLGFQEDVQRTENELKNSMEKANDEIFYALSKLVADYGKSQKVMAVLQRESAIYFHFSLDLTVEFLKKLDATLPNVTLDKPKALQ